MNTTPRTSFFTHLRIAIVATVVLSILVGLVYPLVIWGAAQLLFPSQANGSLISKDGKVVGSALIGQPFAGANYFQPRPSDAGNGYDPTRSGGSNLGPTSAKLFYGTTKQPPPPTPDATAAPATAATAPAPAPAVAATAAIAPGAAAPAAAAPALVVDYDGLSLRVLHYCHDNGIPFTATVDGKAVDLKTYTNAQGWDEVMLITAFNDSDHRLTIKAGKPIPVDAVTASASGLDPHISEANALLQLPRVLKARHGLSEKAIYALVANATDHSMFGDSGVNVLRLNLSLDAQK